MAQAKAVRRTALDYIILEKIEATADERGHFNVSDILHAVLSDPRLAGVIKGLFEKFDRKWHLDTLFAQFVKNRVRLHLRKAMDSNGLRRFESYSAGEKEHRWQPLRYMTRDVLKVVIAERRTLHGQIGAQIRRYEIILHELEKYGERTRVDTVYDDVLPLLRKLEKEKVSA
jgi:hypothetical protein